MLALRWRAGSSPLHWYLVRPQIDGSSIGNARGMVVPRDDLCPFCWGKALADYVDIGVGSKKVGPAHCTRCHALEESEGVWLRGVPNVPQDTPELHGTVRGPTRANNKGSLLFRDQFRVVCVGKDPRKLRRAVYEQVAGKMAADIENALDT